MTVKELIEELKEYPDDMEVVTPLSYGEESYQETDCLFDANVVKTAPCEYEQAYEGEEDKTIKVVCIS